jgi:hypothetical protein
LAADVFEGLDPGEPFTTAKLNQNCPKTDDTPYRVQALDTDLSPVYRARRDQSVAMVVLRIALWRLERGIGIRAGCDEGAKLKKVDESFLH